MSHTNLQRLLKKQFCEPESYDVGLSEPVMPHEMHAERRYLAFGDPLSTKLPWWAKAAVYAVQLESKQLHIPTEYTRVDYTILDSEFNPLASRASIFRPDGRWKTLPRERYVVHDVRLGGGFFVELDGKVARGEVPHPLDAALATYLGEQALDSTRSPQEYKRLI